MKNLILVLSIVASLNLACAQPQKFEANLAIINKDPRNSEVAATPTNALIFTISEDKKVFLQKKDKKEFLGTTSETEKLRRLFTDLLKEKVDKTVFVRTSSSVKYGDVSEVIDLLKLAGAKPIGLAVEGLE